MLKNTLLCLAALAIAASVAAQTPPPRLPADQQSLWNGYFRSIYDSGVYERANVRELYPLRADTDGNVLVATLTTRDGNVGEPLVSSGDGIWVTVVPEVQTICRGFRGDVTVQLRQLLGLPPDAAATRFLVLRAKASDIFRPSPYAETSTRYPCAPTPDGSLPNNCGNVFPSDATPAHIQWIATQSFALHAVPYGYPWTHLGYTYNWTPGKDRYGASEYVIRPPATAVIVQKSSPIDYCSALP